MKKYKVVGLPKMQNGGPGDKKDPDNMLVILIKVIMVINTDKKQIKYIPL
jgi:hypothetical protein